MKYTSTLFIVVCLMLVGSVCAAPLKDDAVHRRPVALEYSAATSQLLILNQRSASMSIFDTQRQMILREDQLGGRPTDMEWIDGTALVAVSNDETHVVSLYRVSTQQLLHVHDIPSCRYPIQLKYDARTSLLYVAGLWSRQLAVLRINKTEPQQSKLIQLVDLSFAPRKMVVDRAGDRMIIGDAYGGTLGIADISNAAHGRLTMLGQRTFPGHNVRGLELSASGEMLLIAHQMLNELAHTVRNDVHWGLLMSNDLRWLRLENVIKGGEEMYTGAHMHPLGEAGSATGDPTGMVMTKDGTVVVILGGVGEIAYGQEDDFSLQRIKVGLRPMDIVVASAEDKIYVANMLSDSISVVSLQDQQSTQIPLGPQGTWTEVDRGERLFFNAKLSHDGWMSCHSCHTDGHTNGLLNDNFSDKSFGAPKRVLTLLGKANTAPFAWNGKAADLQTQIKNSLTLTMQMDDPPSDEQLQELAAFVKTLPTPPSIDEARNRVDKAAIARGQKVFQQADCRQCHAPPAFTVTGLFDVGLSDSEGNLEFNPPSLLGVGQRVHFFHNNTAKTLSDVFLKHKHPLGPGAMDAELLTPQQVADLVNFLRSL
ncbi:MAG: c-type cytochrome [Planctomycetaceae bacterium]|jgi:cytochrome c peroxidase|nr:c-type cytochrome [Planctomycetaceae bacterium]MBT4011392.1 c-type cytochrome [Planctomycetaceae bacterium]MBT4726524.1 c-type cytochrome [Planctomycetaceae bacterium]MBT4844814.1 c-type cytochrome [Planctomycetaceae bacterium]MBT5124714.1 c-type cytochrome [Planctomycetaceae bacterium]